MNILVIGQCTLHWGRMEFGNIGNYYIVEPFFRELHLAFPGATIRTTMQMTDEFCARERVVRLPMELYYGWNEEDLKSCMAEYGLADTFSRTGFLTATTPYIDAVLESDLVIDFSGDIWGDNADFLGPHRFLIGAYKDLTASLLRRSVAMIAGSPGPFEGGSNLAIARRVFSCFDLVTHREQISIDIMKSYGLENQRQHALACPAFLFEPAPVDSIAEIVDPIREKANGRPLVGFIICGWNMTHGPFDRWPRDDEEFAVFVEAVEHIVALGADVVLMSHANGFRLQPDFQLIHGRDFPLAKHLSELLASHSTARRVHLLDGTFPPAETKAIIGQFDMLVSGRVHAAVAGLSQAVPTVILDYGHEPKAHKLKGFARVAGVEDFVADPGNLQDVRARIDRCWADRSAIRAQLTRTIPAIQDLARRNFALLKTIV